MIKQTIIKSYFQLAFLFIAAVVLAVASAQYLAAYPRAGLVGAPLYTGAGIGYAGLGYRGLGAYPGYGYGGAIYG